jgi:hypothetical protein
MEKNSPRLLIVAYTLASLRAHYDDVIESLTRGGVHVSIRYVSERGLSLDDYRETWVRRACAVEVNPLGSYRKRDRGDLLALRLRELANLLRFSHPDYRGREWLRDAKFEKASRVAPGPRRWARRLGRLGSHAALLGIRVASRLDRVLPPPRAARALLASERPDAVAVVGVVFTPSLVDFLKAAAWEGIPTAHWVQSWDNLTNKGLLHFPPDRVFVWNDFQREELVRYHGIPERRACVTGAQTFDHWFNGDSPSRRAEFCSQNGLDPDRPIITYLVSSRQIEPPARVFFLRWLEAIRSSSDPVLEGATVFVRPHPTDVEPWLGLERRDARLAVSPSIVAAPINSPEYRQRFRDELHHASVAVGLNTSGMIDAAILGKPVCTVELSDVPNRQRGTIHFEYLMTVGGGFVRTATTLEEHVGALAQLVRKDPYERDERSARFLQQFIRPCGLDVTPATVFSEAIFRLLESPSDLRLPSQLGQAIGRLIHQGALVLGAPLEESVLLTRRRRRRFQKLLRRLQKPVRRLIKRLRTPMRRPVKYWRGLLLKYRKPVRRLMKQLRRPIRWPVKYWRGLLLKYRTP